MFIDVESLLSNFLLDLALITCFVESQILLTPNDFKFSIISKES